MSESLDSLEERIRQLEIDASGEPKKITQLTILLKLFFLIPLTIVVGNHLGSFLPLPIVCKEYSFGGISTRIMSHILLIFLIAFSISGSIDYTEFFGGQSSTIVQLVGDGFFTFLAWLSLILLLRLRHAYMYLIIALLLLGAYVSYVIRKSYYDERITNLKNAKTDSERTIYSTTSSKEKMSYWASFILLMLVFLCIVIFYYISFKEYLTTLPNFENSYTKPIKLPSGKTYFVKQEKLTSKDKGLLFLKHAWNPEIPSDTICAKIRSTDDSITLGANTFLPSLKFGKDIKTKNDLQNELKLNINKIQSFSPKYQREIFENESFIKNLSGNVQIVEETKFSSLMD